MLSNQSHMCDYLSLFQVQNHFSNMILATIRLLLESCGLEGNACFGTKVAGTSSKA